MIKRKFYDIANKLTADRIIKVQKEDNCLGVEVNGIVLTKEEIEVIEMLYADTETEAQKMNELLNRFNLYSYQWLDCDCYTPLSYKIKSIEEHTKKKLEQNKHWYKQLTLI